MNKKIFILHNFQIQLFDNLILSIYLGIRWSDDSKIANEYLEFVIGANFSAINVKKDLSLIVDCVSIQSRNYTFLFYFSNKSDRLKLLKFILHS